MALGNTWEWEGQASLYLQELWQLGGDWVLFWMVLLEMEVGLNFWKRIKREGKVNCWKWSLGGNVKGL